MRRRLRDIGEARIALEDPTRLTRENVDRMEVLAPPRPLWRRAIPVVLSAIVAGTLTGTAVWYLSQQILAAASSHAIPVPPAGRSGVRRSDARPVIALAPDGAQMVYAANTQLFVRSMSGLDVHAIQGTEHDEGVTDPVFSPDGQSIVFYASEDRSIKKIAVTGGVSQSICRAEAPYGISWGPGVIVFGQGSKGIMRVSRMAALRRLSCASRTGKRHMAHSSCPAGSTCCLRSPPVTTLIDGTKRESSSSPSRPENPKRSSKVEGTPAMSRRVTSCTPLKGTLFAVAFDVQRLQVTGARAPVVEDVRRSGGRTTGASHFSISRTGSLIYIPGLETSRRRWEIALTDRQGGVERLKLPPGRYSSPPRVSPDGMRIAFGTDDGQEAIIYTYDLNGASTMQRLTSGGNNRFPVWSSDSKRVAFQSDREGDLAIWQSAVGGNAERLTKSGQGESHAPESWHPKADLLLFSVTKGSDVSLWTFSTQARKASPFDDVHSFYPTGARFSPDGQWIAYASRDQGEKMTIYVQPFPPTGSKFPLFVKGPNPTAHKVAWSPDGKELFYVPRIGEFEAVTITTTPTFAFGNAVRVPRPFQPGAPNERTLYDVTPSGKFVGLMLPGQAGSFTRANSEIQVVLNWTDELKRLVPTN